MWFRLYIRLLFDLFDDRGTEGQKVGGPSLGSLPKIHDRCSILWATIYVSCDDTESFLELTVSLQVSMFVSEITVSTFGHVNIRTMLVEVVKSFQPSAKNETPRHFPDVNALLDRALFGRRCLRGCRPPRLDQVEDVPRNGCRAMLCWADPPAEVLGMLENDDTLPPEKRIPHREVGLGGLRSQMISRGIRSHPFLSWCYTDLLVVLLHEIFSDNFKGIYHCFNAYLHLLHIYDYTMSYI